jgi:tetratricopeptide (TPR) repeat protein
VLIKTSTLLLAVAITGIIGVAPSRSFAQAAQGAQTQTPPATGAQGAQTQPATGAAASGAERQYKDRAEFDLFDSITKDKNATTRLQKLDQWKTQYPETAFKKEQREWYLTTYVELGRIPDVVSTAKQILADDPNHFRALYYITLYTPAMVQAGATSVPPDVLDQGEKAASGMLSNLDKQKPATMSDADWTNAKKPIEAIAHQTAGWAAMQRKDNEKAEAEFKQSLALNPNNGDVAYWTGLVEAAQKKPEKYPEMLFYVARAASYDGPGAANAAVRKTAQDYLTKAYATYHGGNEGLDKLTQLAKANPAPPAGFTIGSAADAAKQQLAQEEEEKKKNPSLALWKSIKETLIGPDGQAYFEKNMKGAMIPTPFTGKLISMEPATRPTTLVIGVENGAVPDATLRFETPLPGKADPGTVLSFSGMPESFTKDPFMVTFSMDKKNLTGWPVAAAPAKRAAPTRRRR